MALSTKPVELGVKTVLTCTNCVWTISVTDGSKLGEFVFGVCGSPIFGVKLN